MIPALRWHPITPLLSTKIYYIEHRIEKLICFWTIYNVIFDTSNNVIAQYKFTIILALCGMAKYNMHYVLRLKSKYPGNASNILRISLKHPPIYSG